MKPIDNIKVETKTAWNLSQEKSWYQECSICSNALKLGDYLKKYMTTVDISLLIHEGTGIVETGVGKQEVEKWQADG